jgi:hypothetical protein
MIWSSLKRCVFASVMREPRSPPSLRAGEKAGREVAKGA